MDSGLSGKVALVTGASQGIGKAVALGLARERVQVTICSRRHSVLAETARQIESATGSRVVPIVADLTSPEDIKGLVFQIIKRFGTIHILVNCAASPIFGSFLDLPDEAWKSVVETKYMGYVRCLREVIPYMVTQRYGRIVNISGTGGIEPNPLHLLGGSVNAAIELVTKGLAREMGKHNIRINAIAPGAVATERFTRLMETIALEKHADLETTLRERVVEVPLGRLAEPNDIADAVVFLVSDRSSFITGVCLRVDGGRTRGS